MVQLTTITLTLTPCAPYNLYILRTMCVKWDCTTYAILYCENFRSVWAGLTFVQGWLAKAAMGRGCLQSSRLPLLVWISFLGWGWRLLVLRFWGWRGPNQCPWRRSLQRRHQLATSLSIGSPWGSDSCHAPEVAYTSSDLRGRSQRRLSRRSDAEDGGRGTA